MELIVEPKKITWFFGLIILLLTLAHLAAQFSIYVLGYDNIFGLIPLFSLNAEENIPALFSAFMLLFCSFLLALIAYGTRKREGPFFFHWAGLSAIFVFLALDEWLSFHESMTVPLRKGLNTEGLLFYAWIIPYGLFTLVLFLVYLRFLLRLPGRTRTLFILAGILYVTGALLFELPGGIYDAAFGRHTPVYALISTVEELLEMGGILLFIYTLTHYLSTHFEGMTIRVSAPHEAV